MAQFCETLAETGMVTAACEAVGMSTNTAYATRRRVPMFAAAWQAALLVARDRLADTLLARSIEGTSVEHFKDGVLVGETRVLDNRLSLAVLKRLDLMAETGSAVHQNGSRSAVRSDRIRGMPAHGFDWELALTALRTRGPDDVAEALAMLDGTPSPRKVDEAREAHDPPFEGSPGELCDLSPGDPAHRCWREDDGEWWTNFPPPPGFDEEECGEWDSAEYSRLCTLEEAELLDAAREAGLAEFRAEEEQERESYFRELEALAEGSPGVGPQAGEC